MLQWLKWTAKAWWAGISTFLTTFVAQFVGSYDTTPVINEVLNQGFDWGSATIRSFISAIIVWTVTYWVRNAKDKVAPK